MRGWWDVVGVDGRVCVCVGVNDEVGVYFVVVFEVYVGECVIEEEVVEY